MVGGVFQGANAADFSDAVTLYTAYRRDLLSEKAAVDPAVIKRPLTTAEDPTPAEEEHNRARRQQLAWQRDQERLRSLFTRGLTGRFQSLFTEKCYATATDCADIATRFFGVQRRKVDICPLGVDVELFYPSRNESHLEERRELRQHLGFSDVDIVCIYTGRFTRDKNPLLLANAVSRLLAMGEPFRGLFVGDGPQRESIQASLGCAVHPFVPVDGLARYFRAADIGVWPRQESMSMLDAASCGLPIVSA